MSATRWTPDDIVNLDRYPIADLANPERKALVERCRRSLDSDRYFVLPEFVRPKALAAMVEDAMANRSNAYANRSFRNCFLQRRKDASLPEDHPRNIFFDSGIHMIAADYFAETAPLKVFYHARAVMDFVAETVGLPKLYPNEDPLQPANVACYEEGDRSEWHFDSDNDFTMTLMLQAAEEGGEFEIAPNMRTKTEEHTDILRSVLKGDRSRVVRVPREPGALVIFRGTNSVHRVTEVRGPKLRLMGVFVYEEKPGVIGDPEVNMTVYGRTGREEAA